jgi:hypothetical protein
LRNINDFAMSTQESLEEYFFRKDESTSLGLNTICYLFFDPTVIKLQSFFFALQKQYKQISNLTMSQFIFINSAGLITAFCLINLVPQG